MKASKHRPVCPQGRSLYVLYPDGIWKTMSGRRSHPNQLRRVTFACWRYHGSKPNTRLYNLWVRQSEHIRLHGLQSSAALHHYLLQLLPGIPASSQTYTARIYLGKAHQAPLFIECSQCTGLKPNAELDYCT